VTTDEAIRAYLLAESDRGQQELELRLQYWRDGWNAAHLAQHEAYEEGFADGCMALKRAHRDAVELLQLDEQRWGPGGRAHFADPRPGDYPGKQGAAA
jgi:hypothetical protein